MFLVNFENSELIRKYLSVHDCESIIDDLIIHDEDVWFEVKLQIIYDFGNSGWIIKNKGNLEKFVRVEEW